MSFKKVFSLFSILFFVLVVGANAADISAKKKKKVKPPKVTAVTPSFLRLGQSETVTIKGKYFKKTAVVSMGDGIEVSDTKFKNTKKITVKATVASDAETGSRKVTVKQGAKTGTKKNGFKVKARLKPVVTSVTPNTGDPGESLEVVIAGKRFYSETSVFTDVTVDFGAGTTAEITGLGSKVITVTLDIDADAAGGARDVTVTNPDSKEGVLEGGFTVASGVCAYSVSGSIPFPPNFPAEGGPGVFTVTTGVDCEWFADTEEEWIELTGDDMTGTGVVTYTVISNTTSLQRSGNIAVFSVGDIDDEQVITYTITQNASADLPLVAVNIPITTTLAQVLSPDWDNIPLLQITTSGNPAGGGHGAVGDDVVSMTLQAAHDDQFLYIRAQWPDEVGDVIPNNWVYSGTAWVASGDSEDKLYMMFPITDSIGRGAATFSQVGCATACHIVNPDGNEVGTTITQTTTAELTSCALCHQNSGDPGTGFEHVSDVGPGSCTDCHADSADRSPSVPGAGMAAYNLGDANGALDIWNWKAGNTAPLNLAEDMNSFFPVATIPDGLGLGVPNAGVGGDKPRFIWSNESIAADKVLLASDVFNSGSYYGYEDSEIWTSGDLAVLDEDSGDYFNVDGVITLTAGMSVRDSILDDVLTGESGNRDLIATSNYNDIDGIWQVAISRKLNTGDPKDVVIQSSNVFGIAVTDNSTGNHRGIARKILLLE